MSENVERTLGRIESKQDDMARRLEDIESDVKMLLEAKWRRAGAIVVLSVSSSITVTILCSIAEAFFRHN